MIWLSLTIGQWENLGLHPVMVQNIGLCRFDRPTAIQSYAIPAVLANQDLIAVAQTGKTQMVERLSMSVTDQYRFG